MTQEQINDVPISNPSRQERRNLRRIIQDALRSPRACVRFDEDLGTAIGVRIRRDLEGHDRTVYEAFVNKDGQYFVRIHTDGFDCDGHISSGVLHLLAKATKRKRVYANWLGAGPRGRFTTGHHFRVQRRLDERQRDHRAEAAGY